MRKSSFLQFPWTFPQTPLGVLLRSNLIQYEKMLHIGHDFLSLVIESRFNSEELEKNRPSFQRGELIGGDRFHSYTSRVSSLFVV
ncbi:MULTISPECIES: hypothetical protein [Nostoc]|uniref:Uncharacterized protein n=1 Tax=Nostoc foliaceum FACHB-393 TaxID=2692915 RepID=A0ABR8IF25_9NOSO|nr:MULTISPECIES: hypothetical protein [Nostoc]MBD2650176.1 hypothetical protein [Nostoc foliaceum FACHB-393]